MVLSGIDPEIFNRRFHGRVDKQRITKDGGYEFIDINAYHRGKGSYETCATIAWQISPPSIPPLNYVGGGILHQQIVQSHRVYE